jgi:PAS domain S-box-containing protein
MKNPKTAKEKVKKTMKISIAQLAEEIAKAEGIINAIGDGITIVDRTFKILYENQVHKNIMGDNAGKYCYRAYRKIDGICSGCPVAITFKDGKVHTVQREMQTDEGIRYFEITVSPLKDSERNIIAGIEVVREITERKRVEEAFKLLSLKHQAILAAVPYIIMEVDTNKIYTWTNPPGIEFFGEDVIGKEAAFYFEGEQETYKTVQPLFKGEENVFYVESWQRRKDGKKRLLAWWCRVLKDTKGNITGALSMARDITERKEAEIALQNREKELEIKTQNLEELNTALNVLLKKRDEEKIRSEEKVMMNIRELVKPYLEKLRKENLNKNQNTRLDILESNMDEAVSSFALKLSKSDLNITPTEIQVANLIKQGKRSKEIAALLHSSPKAIAFHRESIRKKLGLQNKKTNLQSYLLSYLNSIDR